MGRRKVLRVGRRHPMPQYVIPNRESLWGVDKGVHQTRGSIVLIYYIPKAILAHNFKPNLMLSFDLLPGVVLTLDFTYVGMCLSHNSSGWDSPASGLTQLTMK